MGDWACPNIIILEMQCFRSLTSGPDLTRSSIKFNIVHPTALKNGNASYFLPSNFKTPKICTFPVYLQRGESEEDPYIETLHGKTQKIECPNTNLQN